MDHLYGARVDRVHAWSTTQGDVGEIFADEKVTVFSRTWSLAAFLFSAFALYEKT